MKCKYGEKINKMVNSVIKIERVTMRTDSPPDNYYFTIMLHKVSTPFMNNFHKKKKKNYCLKSHKNY